ncbi:MAG: M23 family metallopeptidase [Chloroflexota bacterium]
MDDLELMVQRRKGAKLFFLCAFAPLRAIFLLIGLILTACGQQTAVPLPTTIPLADSLPTVAETAVFSALESTPNSLSTLPSLPQANATPTETWTPAPPTPEGEGIRPAAAEQRWVPDAGPAAPAEWRPPPLPVPLALHPDDHYWLARPIPSNRRNYDLEWYPFGSHVLAPGLDPYRIHHGLDFPNDTGTPVLAASSGTVIHAGPLPSPRNGVNYYGNTVIIEHDWQWEGQPIFTLYAHTLELFVAEGDDVQQGQLIAGVGSSGEVSGPHLHLEVRVGENHYGQTRNPSLWLVPFEGYGTLAGRFVDRNGRFITQANITIRPDDLDLPPRILRTYSNTVRSDNVWRENFVAGDLPAGNYTLLLNVDDITYRRQIEIFPGRTHFEIISAEFEFVPTATPTPTPTFTATPITPTLTITTTLTATP